MTPTPVRSMLYIPGGRESALRKARQIPTDAIIFDLEDAVAVTEKEFARETLIKELVEGSYGRRTKIVRVNSLHTHWGRDDIAAVSSVKPDGILLPKVDSASNIFELRAEMDKHVGLKETKIWAMMETPRGILNASEIADSPDVVGMVMGTNDLGKELNAGLDPKRNSMSFSLGLCILAAKAAGILIVDGVYNAFKDEKGLKNEAIQGRDLGFDGKTLIHPLQVDVVNSIFAPNSAELDLAYRQIEAFKVATKNGLGVAVLDGKIVENLHVEAAHATIAKAEIIQEMENSI